MNTNDEFILKHTGLVKKIALQYQNQNIDIDDLIQEGFIGLIEAKSKYKDDKNTKFSSFAYFYIKKHILKAIEKETGIVKKDLNISTNTEKIKTDDEVEVPKNIPIEEQKLMQLLFNKKLTLNEAAEELKITREKARRLKQKLLRRLRFLSTPK